VALRKEIERLKKVPVSQQELERVKTQAQGIVAIARRDGSAVVGVRG